MFKAALLPKMAILLPAFRFTFAVSKPPFDPYKLLGVGKEASEKQIQQAYTQLAKDKSHFPQDVTLERQKYLNQLRKACLILKNSEYRRQYDRDGFFDDSQEKQKLEERLRRKYKLNHYDEQKLIQAFKAKICYGKDVTLQMIRVTLKESALGCKKIIKFQRSDDCTTCGGQGGKPGTKPSICEFCEGRGKLYQIDFRGQATITNCKKCFSSLMAYKEKCSICHGSGFLTKQTEVEVNVPKGINDIVDKIILQKQGSFNGKLEISVMVSSDNKFTRIGNDCQSKMKISLSEAISSAQREFETIEGTKIKVNIPPGIKQYQKIVIKNKGFYKMNTNNKGNLIIKIFIDFPKQLSWSQRQKYINQREKMYDS